MKALIALAGLVVAVPLLLSHMVSDRTKPVMTLVPTGQSWVPIVQEGQP